MKNLINALHNRKMKNMSKNPNTKKRQKSIDQLINVHNFVIICVIFYLCVSAPTGYRVCP